MQVRDLPPTKYLAMPTPTPRILRVALIGGLLALLATAAVLHWPEELRRERHALLLTGAGLQRAAEARFLIPLPRRLANRSETAEPSLDAAPAYREVFAILRQAATRPTPLGITLLEESEVAQVALERVFAADHFVPFRSLEEFLAPREWLTGLRLAQIALEQRDPELPAERELLWARFFLRLSADVRATGLLDFVRHAYALESRCRNRVRRLAVLDLSLASLDAYVRDLRLLRSHPASSEWTAGGESVVARCILLSLADIPPFESMRVSWGAGLEVCGITETQGALDAVDAYPTNLRRLLDSGPGHQPREIYETWLHDLVQSHPGSALALADSNLVQHWFDTPGQFLLMELEARLLREYRRNGVFPPHLDDVLAEARHADPSLPSALLIRGYRPRDQAQSFALQIEPEAVSLALRYAGAGSANGRQNSSDRPPPESSDPR